MICWHIRHAVETASTNLDARAGVPGDVFTADHQTAGRGRLDHTWLSPPGKNLMMSVVLDVVELSPEHVATLPLAVGLAVARAIASFGRVACLKWPNDVLIDGRKVAGILCERLGDSVIAGIGVNVCPQEFPPEIAKTAAYVGCPSGVVGMRDAVLAELSAVYDDWRPSALRTLYPAIRAIDCLRGKTVVIRQTDADADPLCGLCSGILRTGALGVGDRAVFAGEAHVEQVGQGVLG